MSYETIHYEVEGRVATIELARPQTFNAMTPEMIGEMRDALAQVGANRAIRAVMITGKGRAFSAGADLVATLAQLPRDEQGRSDLGHLLEFFYNPLLLQMRELPQPVIVVVNGVAAGGASSFALAADLTIAARSASFAQVFVKIGLAPDVGGSTILVRALGVQRAMGLSLLGESFSAEEAHRAGLIWAVVDDAQLMDEARVLANRIANAPRTAVASIKRLLHAAGDRTLREQIDLERDLQRECGRSPDFLEGATAFVEKRAPRFES
jgi:2-(1,2-epoxy-1,2-dihydrophenyl)acetyl-CoA isomerase